jgi:hypothetical protein
MNKAFSTRFFRLSNIVPQKLFDYFGKRGMYEMERIFEGLPELQQKRQDRGIVPGGIDRIYLPVATFLPG